VGSCSPPKYLALREGEGGEGQWGAKQPLIVLRARTLWTFAKGFGEARRAAAHHFTLKELQEKRLQI